LIAALLFALTATSLSGCATDKASTAGGPGIPDATSDASDALDSTEDDGVGSDAEDAASSDSVDSADSEPTDTTNGVDAEDTAPDSVADSSDGVTDTSDASDTADGISDADETTDVTEDITPPDPCPADNYPATFGDELDAEGGWVEGELGNCAPYAHVAVGSRKSTFRLELLDLPDDATVEVYTPHYFSTEAPEDNLEPLAVLTDESGLVREFTFSPEYSGEVVVHVSREDAEQSDSYEVRLSCESGCEHVSTRFPLILMHGLFGTNSYLGILDYWFNVEPAYDELGIEYRVTTSGLLRNSENRADIIAPNLRDILEETGARKLNLLGHSQGGLDARLVSSPNGKDLGHRIASVTSLATPHHGVPIDLAGLLVLFGIQDFTEANAEDFNETYIDHPDVDYYSWGGKTCGRLEFGCRAETGGEVVDPFLSVFYGLIRVQGYESDGLVTVESAQWGTYLGTIPADHLDEVGQIADSTDDGEPFNHVQFFIDEAYRLIDSGY
jgi:hypothetical protein